jgi:ABC-2 type transport system permease protein
MTQIIQKYKYIFWHSYRSSTTYRISNLSWLVGSLIFTAATIYVWYINAQNGSKLFEFNEIFTYYIVGSLISISNGAHWGIGNRVMDGKLSSFLSTPTDPILRIIVTDLGWHSFTNIFNISLMVAIASLGNQFLILPNSISIIIFTLILAIIGFLSHLYMNLFFGCLAFWMTNPQGIFDLQSNLNQTLSGRLIPLSVLPFSGFFSILPFAYFYYLPIQVFLGKINFSNTLSIICIGFIWLIILHFLVKFTWKRGLKKFEAVGL